MPYFIDVRNTWYIVLEGTNIKRIPSNIEELLTPLALAHWIMGDGAFDSYGRKIGRVTLHTSNFKLDEVRVLQDIFRSKFNIESGLQKVVNSDITRGYAIRISSKSLVVLRSIRSPHMYPSLMYKLGL